MTFFKNETKKWQINHILSNKTAQSQGAKRIFNMFTLYSLSDGEIDRFMINEKTVLSWHPFRFSQMLNLTYEKYVTYFYG